MNHLDRFTFFHLIPSSEVATATHSAPLSPSRIFDQVLVREDREARKDMESLSRNSAAVVCEGAAGAAPPSPVGRRRSSAAVAGRGAAVAGGGPW